MSGLDGLGWPNPEDEPKPKKNMTETEARTTNQDRIGMKTSKQPSDPRRHARLVRRCPKCNCGRWRHVGEIARVGISTSGKAWREVDMKIVECMKCDHSWDILTEDSESSAEALQSLNQPNL